jgi:hypothetical protein
VKYEQYPSMLSAFRIGFTASNAVRCTRPAAVALVMS